MLGKNKLTNDKEYKFQQNRFSAGRFPYLTNLRQKLVDFHGQPQTTRPHSKKFARKSTQKGQNHRSLCSGTTNLWNIVSTFTKFLCAPTASFNHVELIFWDDLTASNISVASTSNKNKGFILWAVHLEYCSHIWESW